jgi:hypothetical protein
MTRRTRRTCASSGILHITSRDNSRNKSFVFACHRSHSITTNRYAIIPFQIDSIYSLSIRKISSPVALVDNSLQNRNSSWNSDSKAYLIYTNNWAYFVISTDLLIWSAKPLLPLILLIYRFSMSWGISWNLFLTVSLDSGIVSIIFDFSSSKNNLQVSIIAGKISSSPILWGFLHFAICKDMT